MSTAEPVRPTLCMLRLCPFTPTHARAEPAALEQEHADEDQEPEANDEDAELHAEHERVEVVDELVTGQVDDREVPDGVDDPESAGAEKVKTERAGGETAASRSPVKLHAIDSSASCTTSGYFQRPRD